MGLKNVSCELRNEETENLRIEEYFLQKWKLVSSIKQLTIEQSGIFKSDS